MKSGFVALVGRPNVGKSTILNAILGKKISIVSNKSQTTRDNILGIYNDEESQIIFIDTPGIHKPFNELGVILDKKAYSTIRDCDLAILIIDSSKTLNEEDEYILDHLKFDCPLIVCFNKIDLTNVLLIESLKARIKEKYSNALFIETSAKEKFNLDELIKKVKSFLEEGPLYYDVNEITTSDLKFHIQEIIREKILRNLDKEIPHGVAVVCENIEEDEETNKLNIDCKIIVEKDSHKAIIIGKQGKMIKKIGTQARKDIEELINKHIDLSIYVQVVKNWRNSSRILVQLGYK